MFSLKTEKEGKVLVITFKDYFDLKQSEKFYAQVEKIVPKLKKGFSVLTDLSSLERMDASARLFVEKVMDLLNKNGAYKVIRVIPDQRKDIGFNIMSLFHYSDEVVVHTYKSYQEAEKYSKEIE